MLILSIGNSFSQDATRYIHQIARADGVDIKTVNLYIGGCPLWRHHRNMLSGERGYSLEVNGYATGFNVSLEEALLSHEWDYITMQQVSSKSFDYATYEPYLGELSAYVKKYCPKAKQVIHQTWGYENGSDMLKNTGYATQAAMTADIIASYKKAADGIGTDIIIPSGEIMLALTEGGLGKVHRDTFHAKFGSGRYALGLTWYRKLTENSVLYNTFCDFDEPISPEEIGIIKEFVNKYV